MTHLRDIADIRMGYTFRGSLKAATSGNTAVIQMKDASKAGLSRPECLSRTQLDTLNESYLLQEGDLIFRARGMINSAVLVESVFERTICIAPLMCIRIKDKHLVLPAYLQWFINTATTQRRMTALSQGEAVRMIPTVMMAGLEVILPVAERQEKIIDTINLHHKIIAMEAQLSANKERYTEQTLLQFAKGFTG
jgi:hypothetical protein